MTAGRRQLCASRESGEGIGGKIERFFAAIALVLLGAALTVVIASLILREDLGGTLTVLYLLFASILSVFLGGFSYFILGPRRDR